MMKSGQRWSSGDVLGHSGNGRGSNFGMYDMGLMLNHLMSIEPCHGRITRSKHSSAMLRFLMILDEQDG